MPPVWTRYLGLGAFVLLIGAATPLDPLRGRPEAREEGASLRVVAKALPWLGSPYRLGGNSRSGVDCSGFIAEVLKSAEVEGQVPRKSSAFAGFGLSVSGPIEPGDILLFGADNKIDHVGIALSTTTFIHAASRGPRTGVIISELGDSTWHEEFIMARRPLDTRE